MVLHLERELELGLEPLEAPQALSGPPRWEPRRLVSAVTVMAEPNLTAGAGGG